MIDSFKSYLAQDAELATKMATYQIAGFIPSIAWIPFYNIKTSREIQAISAHSFKELTKLYRLPKNSFMLWKDSHVIWLNQPLFPLAVYVKEKALGQLVESGCQPSLKQELIASTLSGAATALLQQQLVWPLSINDTIKQI